MDWMVHGLNSNRGKRFFSSPKHPDQLWHRFSLLFDGYHSSFPGLKQLGHDDNSPTSSSNVKNEWSHTHTFPIFLHGVDRNFQTFLAFFSWRYENNNEAFSIVNNFSSITTKYHISQTIRRTFFPEKCDLNLTCVLYVEGKYLFPNLWMSLHLLYNIFIVKICFQIMRSGITACEQLTFLSGVLP